ncbi:hypothetical protein [Baekduia sp. Peel2402]|uniref:hypothetical protein n=1 Tax=Baekduia sp. Peel2402 TaxID=3458296 RepID=UPI00403EEBAF
MTIPIAAALVLRDRTNADHQQVLALALDALVADGTWKADRGWRRLRRVRTLTPARQAAGTARHTEPLSALDQVLRRAAADLGTPLSVPTAGAWCALHAEGDVETLPRRTIDDLIAHGLLATDGSRFTVTRAGDDALATAKPPATVRPSAHDEATRVDALQTLSPLARDFLQAYRNALGSDLPKSGLPTGGDNQTAGWRTGTGTY